MGRQSGMEHQAGRQGPVHHATLPPPWSATVPLTWGSRRRGGNVPDFFMVSLYIEVSVVQAGGRNKSIGSMEATNHRAPEQSR